jgi:predicted DNA-binding antitoxin AbrB/MazE fold protein
MTTAVKAIYEDGVFKPKEPVDLREKTEVEVLIPTAPPAEDDPTGWKAMREFIGLAGERAGSGKASEEHDRILYRR